MTSARLAGQHGAMGKLPARRAGEDQAGEHTPRR